MKGWKRAEARRYVFASVIVARALNAKLFMRDSIATLSLSNGKS